MEGKEKKFFFNVCVYIYIFIHIPVLGFDTWHLYSNLAFLFTFQTTSDNLNYFSFQISIRILVLISSAVIFFIYTIFLC